MHKLQSLKEKLLKELNEYADRPAFSVNDVEVIRNLISGINKICEYMDATEDKEEYSNRMSHRGYGSYDGSYRRRDAMGRYSREDGYSRNEDMMSKLYEVMEEAPEHKKMEIKKMIDKLEKM